MRDPEIIYEDEALLVCHKPAGLATQTKRLGQQDMESILKNHVALAGGKAGRGVLPYIGIVHRLDQPVEGVMPMETILSAIIAGAVTLIGVLIANSKSNAVMEYKIEELTREVRKHNGFAEKIPVIQRDIQVLNHRVSDIETHEHERS